MFRYLFLNLKLVWLQLPSECNLYTHITSSKYPIFPFSNAKNMRGKSPTWHCENQSGIGFTTSLLNIADAVQNLAPALIKKRSIGQIRFKEGQIDGHEWLFFLRLMLNNVKVAAVNEVFVLKRKHSNTIGNMSMVKKLPSLLEARKIVFSRLKDSSLPKKKNYLDLLLADVNSLLRSSAKVGLMVVYMDSIRFFRLSALQRVRAIILFFVFWIFKRGNSLSVISSYE